ncbi:DUF4253 domain-containing protein [Blastococcus saxobsidens]|uniref:DUF4253 domain-containing protein n=1 Tax=Blastococcus saxobsidens TaxID=138336 RepID=A0A6L9W6D4_9ACTN|nr:DUF4253 domain-containing protein [Blastococcus saxobsidens]NEK87625.1 DUF4253 domain-containing protein [Blastococcus saxobsidens]
MARSRRHFFPPLPSTATSDPCITVPLLRDVRVPSSLRSRFPAEGRLRLNDIDLGSGRPAVARGLASEVAPAPALWLADHDTSDAAAMWQPLVDIFPQTGLWPLVLRPLGGDSADRPWDSGEFEPQPLTDVDALPAQTVLGAGWADSLVPMGSDPYVEHLRPFGAEFPGLSAPLRLESRASVPGGAIAPARWGRIGLVPCRRPADAIAAIGWHGSVNRRSAVEVSAVLRSWEERFGTVLAALGFATMTLLLPSPPADESEALPIAAELAALCPDVLAEDGPVDGFGFTSGGTVQGLARRLVDRPVWKLWWD